MRLPKQEAVTRVSCAPTRPGAPQKFSEPYEVTTGKRLGIDRRCIARSSSSRRGTRRVRVCNRHSYGTGKKMEPATRSWLISCVAYYRKGMARDERRGKI